MKCLATLLLIAALASCSGPVPKPVDEAAVVEPGVACRVGHDGGPVVTERGIGGTGAPAKTQLADRGIGGTGIGNKRVKGTRVSETGISGAGVSSTGVSSTGVTRTRISGTGIVGVVTGFASICVNGTEVRFNPTVPLSINGSAATTGQLRAGQLVVIKAIGQVTAPDAGIQAQMISIRYEVSGPIEAVDTSLSAMTVAGQRVMVLPTTWVAGRFGLGNWVTVSGLRQPDGTIIASRLDRARIGVLALRGKVNRQRDTVRIGGLVLQGPPVVFLEDGKFVSVVGRYENGAAEVTAVEPDLLAADPAGYFGISTGRIILQAFVHVEDGSVWLSTGQKFKAEPEMRAAGDGYRNAIVELQRADLRHTELPRIGQDVFTASGLRYTSYRAQPTDAPPRSGGHGAGDLVLPPDAPPAPPTDVLPGDTTDGQSGINGAADPDPAPKQPPSNDGIGGAPALAPTGVPAPGVPVSRTDPSAGRLSATAPGSTAQESMTLDSARSGSVALASSSIRTAGGASNEPACRSVHSVRTSLPHHRIVTMNEMRSRRELEPDRLRLTRIADQPWRRSVSRRMVRGRFTSEVDAPDASTSADRALIQAVALKRCRVEHVSEK